VGGVDAAKRAGLIILASFSAFGTFLLRQFMLTIPRSIDQAAEIDGGGKWRQFWENPQPVRV
jgi:ABC-type glycerol-3-phosphate transport system permease component